MVVGGVVKTVYIISHQLFDYKKYINMVTLTLRMQKIEYKSVRSDLEIRTEYAVYKFASREMDLRGTRGIYIVTDEAYKNPEFEALMMCKKLGEL